jgi:hypothetical protein
VLVLVLVLVEQLVFHPHAGQCPLPSDDDVVVVDDEDEKTNCGKSQMKFVRARVENFISILSVEMTRGFLSAVRNHQ